MGAVCSAASRADHAHPASASCLAFYFFEQGSALLQSPLFNALPSILLLGELLRFLEGIQSSLDAGPSPCLTPPWHRSLKLPHVFRDVGVGLESAQPTVGRQDGIAALLESVGRPCIL